MGNLMMVLFIGGIAIFTIGLILILINLNKSKRAITKIIIVIIFIGASSTIIGANSMISDLKSQRNSQVSTEKNDTVASNAKDESNAKDKSNSKDESNVTDVINMSESIYQNEQYTLPAYLENELANGDIKSVALVWDSAKINTSKIGKNTFTGKAPELSEEVMLTLEILANTSVEKNMLIQNRIFGMINNDDTYYVGEDSIRYSSNQMGNITLAPSKKFGFSVIDNQIYYTEERWDIHKINFDGTGNTTLTTGGVLNFVVDQNYIYYVSYKDTKLYKIKPDGTDRQLISDDTAHSMIIDNGWLYYANGSDSNKLYKIKIDGTSRTKLDNNTRVSSIDTEGDFIYYIQNSDDSNNDSDIIYKIKKNGTMKTKLSDEKAYYMKVYDGYIYFIQNGCGPNFIHKVKVDGTESKELPVTDIRCFSIYNDMIFSVSIAGQGHKMHETDLDGYLFEELDM